MIAFMLMPVGALAQADDKTVSSQKPAVVRTIVLGAEDSWPPFSNADGTGLSNSIVREAFGLRGIKVLFQVAPYARLLRMTEQGEIVGLFNVTKEPSTEKVYHFGKQRLFRATTGYYYHVGQPLKAGNFRELVNNERIGLMLGYEYGPFILQNDKVRTVRVNSQENLVHMLQRGRLDAVIMFDAIAEVVLAKTQAQQEIRRAFDGEHSDIYVAFSRKHPEAGMLAEELDAGLIALRESGRLAEILRGQAEIGD
ncbi:substrate-binding periplasmic protein [Emcibacter nanhaiensis]|nr:transporter substrate-binding domain-containing protein [Emcibacter nanhaiensis]